MSQLKREDWLEQSLIVLAKEGIEALTIDRLCQQFAVTKGSFYHHFKNRQSFLEALLLFWEDNYTQKFIEYSQEGLTESEKLERLQEMVVANYGIAEVNIRAWAQNDPLAQSYQERVDQRRMDFLYDIYRQLLKDDEMARTLAKLQYSILIGSSQILPALKAQDLDAMFRLVNHLVVSKYKKET